ncbi:unnamed protein product, partial [Durusdinium trenchii]
NMSAAAHDVPIPDSDSASDGLDFEDCEFIASGNAKPAVWSPGAEVLATADIEYVEPTWEGPEILRRGHSGRIVGLNADGNLLVDWDELETPKPARYDQVQGKEPGADAWGLRSLCGLWSNVLGHLWICPDPWNPEQCLYEEASLDGGFLQGTLKPLSSGGTSWWHGDVWAKFGEHETRWLHGDVWANVGEPEPGLHFASLPRFLVKPELSPEEDKWSHYEEQCQKQIRLQLLPARNQLKVQICGNCGNWNEIGEFERTLPKIGCPLQILRVEDVQKNSKDGQLDCGLGGCEASFCRERGFSLKIQLTIPVKGEVWYVATSQGAVMPPLSLETSSAWTILDCAPPGVELMLSGLHMNSKYDLNVALMRRSVLEYRGVSVQVVTSGKVKTFPDIRTQSKVWYFVRDDGLDEAYRAEDQITLETARSNYRASSSPECLKTVQCQQYTVDLRTMKQISSRQTERDVKRRAVSLVSDAPLADVCLWQLTSQYGQLVAARGTLPGIDASLANLDNAETIAKLLFQAESKVLLPNLPSLPGIFDDLTFAMVLFEKSQRLLRESLQQQSDDGVVAQAVDDRNSQRKHLCSVLKQSAQTIEDVKAFKATATAAMKAFDQSSILLTDLPDLPDLKSLPSVPSMIRSANIADTSREESGAAASHCGTGTSMPRRPSLGGLFGTDADATPGTGPSLGGLFGTGATSGASTSHCGAGPSLGGLFGTGATSGASASHCGTGPSSGGLFGAGATPGTGPSLGPSLGGLFGAGATSGASASRCGTGPSLRGLFGAGATPGTGPSLGGLFGTGATPGTGPSLGGLFGTGSTSFGAYCGTGPSVGVAMFGTAATAGLFGADNPNAPALGTPLPGHAASRPTAATMPKDDALFHVEYTAPLCRKLSTCQAHLRKLRVEEVKGHRLSAATEEAKDRAVQSLQTVSRALEAGSTSVPPNCSGNTALSFAEAIQQEEHFRKVLSRRCKDFHKEVNDCCALARALLRKMIGAVEADLGTLAERVRLAEKHEALLSAPPKEEELHTLEDLYSYARDLHEDNLEKERRLEREQRTQQRRLSGHSEVGPAGSAALEEAKAATAVSRKNVQRAEQEFHRKLIDFVRIKQAPWGLPELRLKVDDEHLDTVDVLTPGRRCSDYEELLPLAGSSSTIFTAKYNEEACVLKELRSMTQSGALRREVLHRKKLKHPLIVPVLAAFEEEDKGRFIAYVHMPRYSCNLEEWCSSESCTLPKMCQVLRDLVLVVTYVHSHHVVHGDLKPSNFLMDSDDHPCLTDFETSQCLDAQSLHSRRTTLVVGASQGYMPPEFPNLTAASDIYSLGCICDHLLQCWAQKWPQNAAEQRKALSTVVAKMQRHETDDRPPAVEVLEDMTSAMKAETVEMSLPLYWRNSAELSYDKYEVLKEDLAEWNGLTTFQQLEHALLRTVHDSCLNRIFGNTLPRISFVQRVENPKLWRRYCLAKEQVTGAMFAPISPPVRPSCPMIDFSRNEYWLWHGTRQSNIDAILEEGLDEHLSRLEGLYGAGIYFSDEACKGLQYSDPGSCCLLFCRVVLGRPYYTKNTLPSMRSLKELKSRQGLLETPDVAGHHSVIVNPGPVQNHPNANGEQVHREFVIFDGAAVYPEYVVGINQ